MDGLEYHLFDYHDSTIHMLAVDLAVRQIRLVPGADAFPFKMTRPILQAVDEGAVAATGCGFNMQTSHGTGVSDQPLHALVIDGDIWTTGTGAGGHGFLIGDGFATTRRNRLQVHVWKPDGTSVEVEHVNRGHEGEVVAFTPRGGTNEYPRYRGKHFYSLEFTTPVQIQVVKVQDVPPKAWPVHIVLESTYDLGLQVGDIVKWKQNLGASDVHSIVSGWPELIHEGENVVDDVELDPRAPSGPDAWYTRRGPRTVLGASLDGGTAYLVATEGRTEEDQGFRLKELAHTLIKHGVGYAVALDSGGSTFLYDVGEDPSLPVPGVYNSSKTLEGIRPDHVATAVF